MNALEAAYDRIEQMLSKAGITNEHLKWYQAITTFHQITWTRDDPPSQLSEEERALFLKIRELLKKRALPTFEATVCELVYDDCRCNRTLIGVEESRWYRVLNQGWCMHLDDIDSALRAIDGGDAGIIEEWTPDLLEQFEVSGMAEERGGRWQLTEAGQQFLVLTTRARVVNFQERELKEDTPIEGREDTALAGTTVRPTEAMLTNDSRLWEVIAHGSPLDGEFVAIPDERRKDYLE